MKPVVFQIGACLVGIAVSLWFLLHSPPVLVRWGDRNFSRGQLVFADGEWWTVKDVYTIDDEKGLRQYASCEWK